MTGAVARGLLIALCLGGAVQVARGAVVPVKAVAAQILLERAFDRALVTHRAEKPWPWADMAPAARLAVPRLGVERVVIDTGSGQAMAFGPTLLPGGARLAERGTAVIAAHRDTHFRFLQDVRRGDVIELRAVAGGVRRYRVTGAAVVRWDGFAIERDAAERRIVLTTCYPFGAVVRGPLRYAVTAVESKDVSLIPSP